MQVKQIDCVQKTATITLNYDELQRITMSLYQAKQQENTQQDYAFCKVNRDMQFLFAIVKNGTIDRDSIKMLNKLQQNVEAAKEVNHDD